MKKLFLYFIFVSFLILLYIVNSNEFNVWFDIKIRIFVWFIAIFVFVFSFIYLFNRVSDRYLRFSPPTNKTKSSQTLSSQINRINNKKIVLKEENNVLMSVDVDFSSLHSEDFLSSEPENNKWDIESDKIINNTGSSFKVLLVDDSKSVLFAMEKIFNTRKNFVVENARDGLDAIAKLDDFLPDLIITDVDMPNMDGFALLDFLKSDSDFSGIPVIFMTSHLDLHLKIAANKVINGFIKKPFSEKDVLEQVDFVLNF